MRSPFRDAHIILSSEVAREMRQVRRGVVKILNATPLQSAATHSSTRTNNSQNLEVSTFHVEFENSLFA